MSSHQQKIIYSDRSRNNDRDILANVLADSKLNRTEKGLTRWSVLFIIFRGKITVGGGLLPPHKKRSYDGAFCQHTKKAKLRQNLLKHSFDITDRAFVIIYLTVSEKEDGSVDEGAEGV